jgi:hypothetical protein
VDRNTSSSSDLPGGQGASPNNLRPMALWPAGDHRLMQLDGGSDDAANRHPGISITSPTSTEMTGLSSRASFPQSRLLVLSGGSHPEYAARSGASACAILR